MTIYQAVYNAMDDWKSGGETSVDAMRVSIDDAVERAIADWVEEQGKPHYMREFPDFDCDLRGHFPVDQGWEDTSWHNDACPSFHLRSKMVSVYVDYLDPEKRESGDESADRFTLLRTNPRGEYPSDGSGPYRSCNTWDEVTEALSSLRSYSEEQLDRIEQLADGIEDGHIQMAVVDYLGMRDADGLVPEGDLDRRFGVRDLRHVEIYGLHVVLLNRKARQAE